MQAFSTTFYVREVIRKVDLGRWGTKRNLHLNDPHYICDSLATQCDHGIDKRGA
jgi:hypothetical protein